jgi:serine phosphatase RsbU (regulator of sigma subunit)/Tfp pilus assembly protein PilF
MTTKILKYFLLALTVCLYHFNLNAQQSKLDSLITILKTDKPDTNKVIHLYKICWEYKNAGKFDTALIIGNQALVLAKELKYKKGIAQSFHNIASCYYNQGNYTEALQNTNIALKTRIEIGDKKGIGDSYNSKALVYIDLGNFSEAQKNIYKALKIRNEIGDKKGIANCNSIIGLIFQNLEKNTEALEKYSVALKGYKDLNDNWNVAIVNNNIASIYASQGNYTEALKLQIIVLNSHRESGFQRGVALSLYNIADIHTKLGNYSEALNNANAAVKIRSEIGEKNGVANSYLQIGKLYIKLNKLSAAKSYLDKAIVLSKEINSKSTIRNTYSELETLDSIRGDYKGAYLNHKLFINYRDSLDNIESEKKMIRDQMSYEFEKKEAIAKSEQERKDIIESEEKQKQKIITWSLIVGFVLVLAFAVFIFRSLSTTRKQKNIIVSQKHLVEEKHKEITDSINYAERIQRSFLATKEHLTANLNEYFILFKPKDVVSGDFYWSATLNNGNFALVTADSTGHGVPGAIMSLLNIGGIEKAIESHTQAADILNSTRKTIIERLKKDGSPEGGKDGMDASLCVYDFKNKRLTIAAANNPVWIMRGSEVIEIKPDKMPIGKHDRDSISFTQQEIDLQVGDVVYTLTDGFPDQFGGESGKKFMIKKLREFIASIAHLPMQEQKQLLEQTFANWVGNLEQVDDVCLIGVRV